MTMERRVRESAAMELRREKGRNGREKAMPFHTKFGSLFHFPLTLRVTGSDSLWSSICFLTNKSVNL